MQLSKFITRLTFSTAFISILFAFLISVLYQYNNFEKDKLHIKEEFTEQKKKEIKREVLSIYNVIEHKEALFEKDIHEKLKNRVYEAYNTAYFIYNQNKNSKTIDEIKYLIANELNSKTYKDDKTYFFINSNKGDAILFNKTIQIYNKNNNIWNYQDEKGNFIIQNQAKIALEQQEGFLINNFVKPDSKDFKQYSKISFIKNFEPLDWHIGMGEYIDEIRELKQKEILEWISTVRFGDDGYIFVNSLDKKALVFDGKKLDVPIEYPNDNLFKMQLEQIKNKDGGFFSYKFKKLNSSQEFDKIGFVISYDKYNWIIGSGIYIDEIDKEIKRKEAIFKETINNQIISMIFIFLIILGIIYLFSKNISKYINKNIMTFVSSFEKASKYNQKIDTKNLTYSEFISLAQSLNITLEEKNETEQKLQDYLKIINKNIIISSTNKDGFITDVSEAFCNISGYSKEELIGKTHKVIRHPNTPDEFYKKLWEKLSNGQEWEGEIRNKNKKGDDYWVWAIIKPIFKNKTIIGFTAIKTDITDKKYIEQLSLTDELTQLYNRRFFNTKIIEEINRAKRDNNHLSFMILDVDFFKQYNDTYGHQMGDIALEEVAKVLKARTNRASDFAFRLGGEEFGIITALDKDKAVEFANLIKEEIENLKIENISSKVSPYLTISIGIVSKNSSEITNSSKLYKEADDNLYHAKNSGRNRVFIQ